MQLKLLPEKTPLTTMRDIGVGELFRLVSTISGQRDSALLMRVTTNTGDGAIMNLETSRLLELFSPSIPVIRAYGMFTETIAPEAC